jgi:predicted Zn finger-like uncharacterized protein
MRFLCEQCKAKYQIADEKVAGKTVRMKCRKCGHLIEVKAEVTETSVASKAPPPPEPGSAEDDATRVGMDVNAMMMKLSPGPAAPTKPQAPRPGAPAAPRPTGLATSLASQKPAPKPAAPPKQESALAGAFQKNVAKDDAAMLEISTSSEWYVAINGVPVGPVRISELRRKASTGAVNADSLVWQEGMEEWRPLQTIPELVAILQEGLSTERPSLTGPAPNVAPSRAPSHPPRAHPTPVASAAAPKPTGFGAPPPRNNVVSLASRLATAEKLEPEEIGDPFAAPAPISAAVVPAPLVDAPISAVAAPTVVLPRKNGPNWIVIGMVVAFGAFGATAGIAVFFKPQPAQPAPTIVVTTQPPAPTTPTTAGNPVAMATDVAPVTSSDPSQPRPQGGGVARPTTTGAATSTGAKPVDPALAALLGGPGNGPTVSGAGGGGGAGSALSEESIQKVVQQRSAGVKRTCWERGGGTESNVNVRVHLTIAATGNVQNASAEGNDPIVSKCIENSVRNWSFPPSSGPTTVDIPFHFLRQ